MSHGPEHQLLDTLQAAAEDLSAIFREELGIGLSYDKLVTIANTQKLADKLAARLGVEGAGPSRQRPILALILRLECGAPQEAPARYSANAS
jgi:hypothetical protein